MSDEDLMQKIVSLAKRRGFVFQSSEIYGGLKSAYDYGPLGVELKRNIMNHWWRSMVHEREDVVGLDASIVMHPKVWDASGHLAGFSDPLVDCRACGARFRADKAPLAPEGQSDGPGYVCPTCESADLSDERPFNLMFRTHLGPVDPIAEISKFVEENKALTGRELRDGLAEIINSNAVYLRPETAQAMFVQFLNVQQSMSMKVPFGIAQMGKSFRNEVTVEHFIFRSCEFEQMEMEFFVEPGTQGEWLDYWKDLRLNWWQSLANHPDKFILRPHEPDELAHYADNCYDVEFEYPWGFDELEGIASRTDYDLNKHQEYSRTKLSYFDQNKVNPETGKNGWRFIPYVIEPAAGATRAVLAFLLDAYTEEELTDSKGNTSTRVVLKLHPALAPIKAAVLPLVKKEGMPEIGRDLVKQFFANGINARYDEQHAIGKRYRRHDEAGTPYCLTIDGETKENGTVTIRDRDTMEQERIPMDSAVKVVRDRLGF